MSILRAALGPNSGEPETPASLLRVAVYARKSNEDDEGRSKSTTQQLEFGEKTCEIYGFSAENTHLYEEALGQKGDWYWRDPEGRNPEPHRPELTRLMNDIAAGKIDVVVVWRSDRLTRDGGVGDALAKAFRKYGTHLICGGRDVGIDTSSGLYQFSVESANNRRWRDQISEDIIRDKEFKMALGMFVRDPSCLGFRSKGKKSQAVEPKWDELDLVLRIFTMFVIGENGGGPLGINAICNRLMDEGISIAVGAKGHKAKHPEKVHTRGIRIILSNCEYIGKFRYKDNEYDCKALLISRDGEKPHTAVPITLYEAAQEKLRLTDRPGKRSAYSDHMLSGIVVCAYCGRPLHVHQEPKMRNARDPRPPSKWFICSNRKPPRYCKPYGMRMLQEDVVDDWVLKELAPLLAAEIRDARSAAAADADRQVAAELDRKMAELEKKEGATLKDMVGVLDREQIAAVATQFRAEREQLRRRLDEIRARLDRHHDLPDLSAEALATMPNAAIKDALRRAVQWIAIGKEGIIVLTSFGTYIGATIRDVPRNTYRTSDTRSGINPPTPESCLRCLSWLPSPEDFVKGRRNCMGPRGEELADAEILPGVSDVPAVGHSGEVEVTYERLDEAS